MKLKILPLIFILYAPFVNAVNAVNLVCQANEVTEYWSGSCRGGCKATQMFSIIFNSKSQKIIEVTDFSTFSGQDFYGEKITPSMVSFELPSNIDKGWIVGIYIERVSGEFTAQVFSYDKKYKPIDRYTGKCRVDEKLF